MAAEVLFNAAAAGDMPGFLARTNDRGVPATALLMTTSLVQLVLLLGLLVYALGTVLFVMSRRERGQRVFSPAELVLLVVVVLGAVVAVAGLATGLISI